VNYAQRWLRRLGQATAVFRDPDAGLLLPLPGPLVDPRLDAERLTTQAREQGRSDGKQFLYDGWSFGGAGDSVREPAYVEELRERCEGAVREHHDRQLLTEARMADLHLVVRDAERDMHAARRRMAHIAMREQLEEDESLRSFLHRRNIEPDEGSLPPLGARVWEGDAPPMRLRWRAAIVIFLGAVVYVIERYAAEAYLPVGDVGQVTGQLLIAAIAALTVIGPLVAGQLFRNRHATGYDRPLAALTFALLLPTLAIVLGLGLLAATLYGRDRAGTTPAGTARSAAVSLTPATLIVVFDVVLFLACTMAYLMGLAQPHPFQQAFASNRQLHNRTVNLIQRMGTRINADYRAPLPVVPSEDQAGLRPDPAREREEAIRHTYGAAESAYYQGLIEAVADPTFTEAILRRRSWRTGGDHG